MKKFFFYTLIGIVFVNYFYFSYTNDSYKKDVIKYILEQLLLLVTSGSGIFILIKIYMITNWKRLLSELFFYIYNKDLLNHNIYDRISLYTDNLERHGFITGSKGRLELLKTILDVENLFLKFFISSTIDYIYYSKQRTETSYISNIFQKHFFEYTREVIVMLEESDVPQIIISLYCKRKQTFIDSLNFHFINMEFSNFPSFVVMVHTIDILAVSIEMFLANLLMDIDTLNGQLKDIEYKGNKL
jgi:hypothetical protein